MSQYLLSVHTVEGQERPAMTPEVMAEFMTRINRLEAEMEEKGAFLFTGGLHGPDTATVVRKQDDEFVVTDGPFAESKEHIGGFYVIEAADLDEALAWAEKVVDAVGRPIEVRPFFDSRSA